MSVSGYFVGRNSELAELRALHARQGSHIGVVYGRRRVGKTELIRMAYQDRNLLSFEGVENQNKQEQIRNFLFQLEYQTGERTRSKSSIRSWREAFSKLIPLAKGKPTIILLDELQWMANYRSDLVSDLKMIWDQYLSRTGHVTLILCGSIASFMQKKVVKSKSLYGRTDLCIHLKPFQIRDTAKLLSERSNEEILLAQLLVGGIPKYLNLLKEQDSILLGIDNLAFSETGYFIDEYERIFVSHFSTLEKYEQIIAITASNPYGQSRQELVKKSSSTGGGELTRVLYNLESAGFIGTYTPFDKKQNTRTVRYLISDPFMRLYFDFIQPYKLRLSKQPHYFINHIAPSPKFLSWLGHAFELFCLNHSNYIASLLGFSAVEYRAGPYFKHSKGGGLSGVQIDLIFDRADKVITLCEIKYRNKTIGLDVVNEVQNKIDNVPQLQKRTVQKVLISKSKPSQELVATGYFSKIISLDELIRK